MRENAHFSDLLALLRTFGAHVVEPNADQTPTGFPLKLDLKGEQSVLLEFHEPALLSALDPDTIGVAILDSLGYPRHTWGLARRLRTFKQGASTLISELSNLVSSAFDGIAGSLYLDGYRYHAALLEQYGTPCVLILVVNAQDEKLARRQAHRFSRESQALKKIGRALNMNQALEPLAYGAVHEIASVGEFAAVLLWTLNKDENTLELAASTGANRAGTAALSRLSASGGAGCLAEIVATSRQPFSLSDANQHLLTQELEAKFCYLKPGAISIWPLVTGGNLIGVLELIGREGDEVFDEHQELFETIVEHLALALNSAMLFESVERLASHDSLTGIANHRTLHEFLSQRLAESLRTHAEIGVIMIDVDHFRSFNEEEGHETGDAVLRLVAETLKSSIRPYDLAARYGGEEFAIVLPGSGKETTLATAERIRDKVGSIPFETRSGRKRHVTISVGCAVYPHTANDAGTLLRAADSALFDAKREGRNRTVMIEGAFVDAAREEQGLLEAVWKWVPSDQRAFASDRLKRLEPRLEVLGAALGLSRSQVEILRALLAIEPSYRQAAASGDDALLRPLRSMPEFRLLEPSLAALDERVDGTGLRKIEGARIPLLSRVLAALAAFDESGGRAFADDPGRFDAEIVARLIDLEDAA